MAPPWFARTTSCCFGFLTGTRAPLFSLTNFRLVAILTNLLGVRKIAGSMNGKELRCVTVATVALCRAIEMYPILELYSQTGRSRPPINERESPTFASLCTDHLFCL